jgi:HlyD family secretion protein
MKNFFKKKWVKRSIIIIAVILVLMIIFGGGKKKAAVRTFDVERKNIEIVISGNGAITASEARQQISEVSSTITNVFFKEGDEVKKGDLIASLDSSDYEVSYLAQKINLNQTELSKKNIDKQITNLAIKAPVSGYVSGLNLNENDFLMGNTQICNIINANKYEVILQFIYNESSPIRVGNNAKILLVDTLNYVDGTVTYVGERRSTTSSGSQVIDVTITVTDPYFVLEGVMAQASVVTDSATILSANKNSFTSVNSSAVRAETTGTVKTIYAKNGQYVNAGDIIAQLENDDLVLTAQTTALTLQNLYNQFKYAEDKLNDYKVIAPIDGTITALSLKVGDKVNIGTPLATISNKDEMEFKIAVDELDIDKLSYDKEVKVIVDAIKETEDNPIIGRISKLPLEGVTADGVTDYYVTIAIPGDDRVRISMNADADIFIDKRENVLTVPLEGIHKENGETYVEVFNGETTEKKVIKTGLSDVSYVEILEGLEEGEKVVVPELGNGFQMPSGGGMVE